MFAYQGIQFFFRIQTGWNSTNAILSSKEDELDEQAVPMHDYPIEMESDDEDWWIDVKHTRSDTQPQSFWSLCFVGAIWVFFKMRHH